MRASFLAMAAVAQLASSAPPPPLEPTLSALMNATCARAVAASPTLPPADAAAFMELYHSYNGTGSEAAVTALAEALLSGPAVQAFLTLPDSFVPAGLDADLVLCAVLHDATPLGLAEFAAQGTTEENLVYTLLNDTLLMRDMLVAGGPSWSQKDAPPGQFGPAMAIYAAINASSTALAKRAPPPGAPWDDRDQTTVLRRLALGTALANAVPISTAFVGNGSTVDPVARYLQFEAAYLAGDLDPAFEVLTVFECALVADADALEEDLRWLRETMANYRPDYIAMDYSWRYIQAVHQEVPYGDPVCPNDSVCNHHYSAIPLAGGVCGPRAFFSRFARKAFGLPTWGVEQPGHAAMSSWSPTGGWHTQLGAGWQYGYWGPRSGDDFDLEVQAREDRAAFQAVLRGGWVAKALGEAPVATNWVPSDPRAYGKGGVWGALMLYAKKIAVNATAPLPPRPIGPSVVPTKVAALIAAWPDKWPKPNVTTDGDGTIVIPAAALDFVNRSAAVNTMKSFDLQGEQVVLIVGDYVDVSASAFGYDFTVPAAGTRYLTVNHSTWHIDIDLLVRVNNMSDDALLAVPVYYTVGHWRETPAIAVPLAAGQNSLRFMRSTEAVAPIAVKDFKLYVSDPGIPSPPGNFTPGPPVPRPNKFIEVPALTTCTKQGITPVPAQYCSEACESLGFKYSGGKPRMNFTGCIVLDSTPAGCFFNTNASAQTCAQQPCTVLGSVAQQLCLRQ